MLRGAGERESGKGVVRLIVGGEEDAEAVKEVPRYGRCRVRVRSGPLDETTCGI